MKNILFTSVLILMISMSGVSSALGQTVRLKNINDSVSYAIGTAVAIQLMNDKSIEIDYDVMLAAMQSSISGTNSMSESDAHSIIMDYETYHRPKINLERAEKYLKDLKKKNKKLQYTESGLMYEIVDQGTGRRADSIYDVVVVEYEALKMNGDTLDSTEGKGPATFQLNRVIEGFAEGVMLIGEGGCIKIWIPSHLGYKDTNVGGVGPNEILYFYVKLNQVIYNYE